MKPSIAWRGTCALISSESFASLSRRWLSSIADSAALIIAAAALAFFASFFSVEAPSGAGGVAAGAAAGAAGARLAAFEHAFFTCERGTLVPSCSRSAATSATLSPFSLSARQRVISASSSIVQRAAKVACR